MNTKALAIAAGLWVPMVASAATEATVTEQQESLAERLELALSKTGISIGGQFRGEIGAAQLSGNAEEKSKRDNEQIGYTSIDFDLRARPNTATTARAVFRMHLDHNNFFGAPYAPIQTRWLSMDGGMLGMMYYHMGNMSTRWSPLTVWSDEPSFLYTPRVFAQQQKAAMAERFLGGNQRNLQGVNLGLRAAVPAASIDSFNVEVMAAKLLSAGPIAKLSDENIAFVSKGLFGDGVSRYPDSLAVLDRWALGARGNVTFLGGITLGANYIGVKDLKSTFGSSKSSKLTRTTYDRIEVDGIRVRDTAVETWRQPPAAKVLQPSDLMDAVKYGDFVRDSLAQDGRVISFLGNVDGAKLMGNNSLILGLEGELALSSWQAMTGRDLTILGSKNDTVRQGTARVIGVVDTGWFKPIYSNQTGNALNVALKAGWKTSSWTGKVRVGYLANDSLFRSDLAQSPVFLQGRIYNSEQDYVDELPVALMHYNTFDALYHYAHRWVAEDKNQYAKGPYDKIAYTNYAPGMVDPSLGNWTAAVKEANADYVAAPNDSDAQDALYGISLQSLAWDRELQLVLPVGEASANRVGPKFGLDFDLMQGGVEVLVNGYILQEAKGSILDSFTQVTAEKAKFQQIQAGTRVRVDRFIDGWSLPIEVTGSVGLSTAKGGMALDYASTAINAGLYVGVYKRVALTGGFQQIKGDDKLFEVDRTLTNMAGGVEFKVQEGATLLAMYNLLKTEYPNAARYNFDQSIWSTKIAVSF